MFNFIGAKETFSAYASGIKLQGVTHHVPLTLGPCDTVAQGGVKLAAGLVVIRRGC